MDIQRGDQVYYRGEVWTVQDIEQHTFDARYVRLIQTAPSGWVREKIAYIDSVRHVEQVR